MLAFKINQINIKTKLINIFFNIILILKQYDNNHLTLSVILLSLNMRSILKWMHYDINNCEYKGWGR